MEERRACFAGQRATATFLRETKTIPEKKKKVYQMSVLLSLHWGYDTR